MNKEYTIIDKYSLAMALNFLGFRYYIYDREGKKIYSFEKTEKFSLALSELLKIRSELNNIN